MGSVGTVWNTTYEEEHGHSTLQSTSSASASSETNDENKVLSDLLRVQDFHTWISLNKKIAVHFPNPVTHLWLELHFSFFFINTPSPNLKCFGHLRDVALHPQTYASKTCEKRGIFHFCSSLLHPFLLNCRNSLCSPPFCRMEGAASAVFYNR